MSTICIMWYLWLVTALFLGHFCLFALLTWNLCESAVTQRHDQCLARRPVAAKTNLILELTQWNVFQTLHDGNLYWALPVCTSFVDQPLSREQLNWEVTDPFIGLGKEVNVGIFSDTVSVYISFKLCMMVHSIGLHLFIPVLVILRSRKSQKLEGFFPQFECESAEYVHFSCLR